MDVVAAIIIGIGVIIGIIMAIYGFQKKHIPKGLAIGHGIFISIGLIILIIYALTTNSHHKHWDSIIIFLVAASGGIYLFIQDMKRHYFKLWIMVIHATIGLFGLVWISIHLMH